MLSIFYFTTQQRFKINLESLILMQGFIIIKWKEGLLFHQRNPSLSLTRPGDNMVDLLKEPSKRKIPAQKNTVNHILQSTICI